ncbi:MAG: hypothetical protein A2V66_07620 [Ignavibacteria bacterium RBG_13_36_8]|nr:MAG: hypothetical protein A2V66_07620 [Ignavibacteria bacterium RBG_13_36_8]
MKVKSLLLLLILVISLVGCRLWGVRGSGHLKTEVRDVEDFSEVEIGGEFVVEIVIGESRNLEITAEDNLLKYIETRVSGDKLIIDTKKNLAPRKQMKIKISNPNLEGIESSGANDIYASGINENQFRVDLSGAGTVEVKGEAERVYLSVSGAGSLDCRNLLSKHTKVELSGAASADVYASESLDAEVSGVGSIDFYGDPEDVRSNVSGVGSISRK